VPASPRSAALAWATAPRSRPEGRIQPQAAEHLNLGWAVFQEGAGRVDAVDPGVDGAPSAQPATSASSMRASDPPHPTPQQPP